MLVWTSPGRSAPDPLTWSRRRASRRAIHRHENIGDAPCAVQKDPARSRL
jgi:hypothetical protein